MKQKGFMKKFSAVLLAATMTVSTFPQLSTPVFASDTANELPTTEQFATVEQLKSFDTNDQNGKNPAKVYFGNNSQQWWIAGSQNGNLTLFAASPLARNQVFEPNSNQNKQYSTDWNCDYTSTGGSNPTEVSPNHYGASPLRTKLQDLESSYFTSTEQGLMNDTTIHTNDTKNNSVVYSTTNKLYLAYGDYDDDYRYITVGVSSQDSLNGALRVDMDYWGTAFFWLRAPYLTYSNNALVANPGYFVDRDSVDRGFSLVPAFELNLSSVIFASAAPAASTSDLTLQDTDGNGAFTLRYKTDTLGSALVSYDKSKVTLTGVPSGTYLVVQNSTGAQAKQITNETEVSASDMGLDSFANCKVWLETTDTANRMTYATLATEEQGYDVNITASDGLTVTNGVQGVGQGSAIADITVEVSNGYYLPEDYINNLQSLSWNGLSVSKTDKGFTISGTPTSDVNVKLLAATVLPKSDTPVVELKTSSTSITATVTNHKDDFGDIEYKWNDGSWEKDKNTLSNLDPDTTYKLAVRFTGNGFCQPSDEYSIEITTLKDGNTVSVVPTGLTTTYKEGLTLSDVDLSGTGWTWVDGNTVLSAGTNSYPATFDTTSLESTHDFSGVEGYETNTHKVTRKVEVKVNRADSAVTITTQSLDKAYDGNAVSVPEYTTSGSDGKVTITWQKNTGSVDTPKWEDLKSAPSSVGNYQVIVSLAGNDNYNPASATLDFTISKADNAWVEELSITGWTYNETANVPTAKAKFGEVTFTYSSEENGTYINEVPKNAGTYYVKASVAGTENYTGLESTPAAFEIAKSDTDMSASLKDNKTDFVYGDTIGLTVSVAPRKAKAATRDKVAVFVGENQITDAVDVAEGTPTSISVNTADETVKKYLKPSESKITLTVKYGGSDNLNEEAGSVSIQLAKKDTTIKFKEELDLNKTYDGQPAELNEAEDVQKDGSSKGVTISWQTVEGKELDEEPTNAGAYKVVASVEADDYYKAASVTKEFAITKSDTEMSVSLKDNKTDYVYGDTIGLTVSVAPRKAKAVTQDKVAVFVGENQITDAVDVAEGTPTSISVNTADETVKKYLKPSESEITLTVKYGGSDNLNEEVGSVSIQLAKKDTIIKFKDSLTLDKTYDGQPVELSVAEDIQKDGSSKEVMISWQTADGKELDEVPTNAGTYKVVASVEADDYYKAASFERTFTISKATPTPDKITGLVLGQGRTLEEVELPEGFAWKDKTQTADELGQHEFEAIFTPQDSTNYEQVEVMISIEVVPNLTPMNHVPTIEASDKELTVGDQFDPLKDVTAKDKEDGDLTSKIEVVENKVDTSKAGTYEVTYKVTDSQGASATKTIKVVVKAKETPTVPENPDEDNKPEKPDADKPGTDKPNAGDSENPPAIKTGDEANLGLWTTVFVISGLGIAVMTILKRRKYNR